MTGSRIVIAFTALLLTFSILSTHSRAQEELVENGSFETGDFTGWTDDSTSPFGIWFIYSASDFESVLPPPVGEYAALTAQEQESAMILYQDIAVPAGAQVSCSVIVYVENTALGGYVIGDGLTTDEVNQQMRIDLMDPEADPYDTGAGVLENLFQTLPGDSNSIGYTTLDFDLTPYASETVRFRAAVVVTEGPLNGSIDDLSCVTQPVVASSIPTLSEWGMIAAAAGLGLVGFFFVARRRKAGTA
jgi:hypothetical protein